MNAPRRDLEALKRDFPRSRLLQLAALEGLGRRGNRIQCPACRDEDPRGASTGEPDGVGLWSCQRCGAGGTAIDLVANARNISAADAIAALAELAGALPAPPPERKHPARDGAALYERLADTDPEGLAYLASRGLDLAAERSLVRFNLGATGDPWLDARAAEGYRVAVPLRNPEGVVKTFQLRCCRTPPDPKKTKLNLPGVPMTGLVFGEPAGAKRGRVYLAEGLADTLAIQLAGVVVIGAPGVDQVRRFPIFLGDLAGREIVLCPQNDVERHQSEVAFAALGRHVRDAGAVVTTLGTPAPHKDPAVWRQTAGEADFRAALLAVEFAAPTPGGAVPVRLGDGTDSAKYPQTDTGNAERLVARHGTDLRYCYQWKSWLAWDGARWQSDALGLVASRAKETVRAIEIEAASTVDPDARGALKDFAKRSESAGARRAMIELAQSEPGIPIQTHDLDRDPMLLNVVNGTLDLRTGALRAHRREELLSKLASVSFDPAATCPRWLAFLDRVCDHRQPVIDFLQRVVGYALTGRTDEQCLFVLYGTGRNGKGTFRDALRALLGEYAHEAEFATFIDARLTPGAAREDLVALMGARFVAAAEAAGAARLDEALIKRLTGNDPIRARRLHENGFEFLPVAKYFLLVNDKPVVRGQDEGIWSRLRLVPFTVTIPPEERDPHLGEKLRAELPGILAWAVQGCRQWQDAGLQPPDDVLVATQAYREEMDLLGSFIAERCTVVAEAMARAGELYKAYREWCEGEGLRPRSQTDFGNGLTTHGFPAAKGSRGARLRRGLQLAPVGEIPGIAASPTQPATRRFEYASAYND